MYEGLYTYLEQCPQLKGQVFNFDFMGATPVQWSLRIPPNNPVLSKTVAGESNNKLDFIIVANQNFGDDIFNNMNNLELFQKIKRWFTKQNNMKNFPTLADDMKVTGVYAQTEGYAEQTTTNSGIYQIQCRVEYTQASTATRTMPRWL